MSSRAIRFAVLFLAALLAAHAAAEVTLPEGLPQILDHIPRAQIFTSHMTRQTALPDVGFVWGAAEPLNLRDVTDSYYYPNQRDLDRKHTADWFKANHPSWITYACDRTTPSYGYVYSWGAYAPLDTTNLEVREYILKTYIAPALKRGYRAIAFDNVTVINNDKRCGIWRDGRWVQLFTGETRDLAHTQAKIDYLRWMADRIHELGGLVSFNASVDPAQLEATRELLDLADIWVEEGGWTDSCARRVHSKLWRIFHDLIGARGDKAFVSINYTCAPKSIGMGRAETSWTVASFLVSRNSRSYLAVLGRAEAGTWVENPDLDPPVGAPAARAQSKGDLFWRAYQTGYAVVNISMKTTATFRVPPGSWTDQWGGQVGSHVELGPRSGLVLLRTGG